MTDYKYAGKLAKAKISNKPLVVEIRALECMLVHNFVRFVFKRWVEEQKAPIEVTTYDFTTYVTFNCPWSVWNELLEDFRVEFDENPSCLRFWGIVAQAETEFVHAVELDVA
jgi:hypothetical protein